MTEVYLLQNQNGYFLNNQQEWVDGREPNRLYKTIHKDEAINSKVELTVKSAELRIQILECLVNDRGIPQIASELLPEIMPIESPEAEDPEPVEAVTTETSTELESADVSTNDSSSSVSDTTTNYRK